MENLWYFLYVIARPGYHQKEAGRQKIIELDASNKDSIEYKTKAIWNSTIYAEMSELRQLTSFYYLIT